MPSAVERCRHSAEGGLVITKEGFSVPTATENQRAFSTLVRHLQPVGSGTFTMPSGSTTSVQNFPVAVTEKPLVFCGILESSGYDFDTENFVPVESYLNVDGSGKYTGITVYSGLVGTNRPAAGQTVTWGAFVGDPSVVISSSTGSPVIRLHYGHDGSGNFVFKQSLPGYNAPTAAPGQLIFDAALAGASVLGKGQLQLECRTWQNVATQAPTTATFAHGFGRKPDILVAYAYRRSISSQNAKPWLMTRSSIYVFPPGTYQPSGPRQELGNTNIDGRYVGGFFCADYVATPYASNFVARCGWLYDCDATNLYFRNYSMNDYNSSDIFAPPPDPDELLIRWKALRVN